MDGIDYGLIKKLPIKYHLLLFDIFNEMHATSQYPDDWKKLYIHFISKGENKGVRPIALTSCLCKLFETLIKNRLQWRWEFHKILPKTQSGFRKGKSCSDNLTNLKLQAEFSLQKGRHLLAAFLGVSGAFDNVRCDILLRKLSSIGCSENLVRFIHFLTYSRELFTDSLDNECRTIGKGVP